jgi:carbamate kinase
MIAQTLANFFILNQIDKKVVTLLTQVVVDPNDPKTFVPSKPIGPFLNHTEVESLKRRGIPFVEDSGRGYRRIVPSPIPLKIVEKDVILQLLEVGVLVVAAGGGGMPVYIDERGCLEGVDAVVDKDHASAVLAHEIRADDLVILTSEDHVTLNYGKPNQTPLEEITVKEAEKYLEEGHFPPGSMGPKVEAAVEFLKKGGKHVVITSAEKLAPACRYETGTRITP